MSTFPHPLTVGAKKTLDSAWGEAVRLNHKCVGTGHIFLGLLSEDNGIARMVLTNLGVDFKSVLAETQKFLETEVVFRRIWPTEEN